MKNFGLNVLKTLNIFNIFYLFNVASVSFRELKLSHLIHFYPIIISPPTIGRNVNEKYVKKRHMNIDFCVNIIKENKFKILLDKVLWLTL